MVGPPREAVGQGSPGRRVNPVGNLQRPKPQVVKKAARSQVQSAEAAARQQQTTQPQHTSATPPSAEATPDADQKFWVSQDGKPVEKTRGEIQAHLDASMGDVQVMSYDQTSGWKPAVAFGFSVTPAKTNQQRERNADEKAYDALPDAEITAIAAQRRVIKTTADKQFDREATIQCLVTMGVVGELMKVQT